MRKILVLNGPNLNLLGTREPGIYGQATLDQINAELIKKAGLAQTEVICYQSNAEVDLINRVQQARQEQISFIIINPAAFTHTSVALRDALLAVDIPFIEVHLSNIFSREAFRQHSYFSDVALGVISGFGAKGYELALDFALSFKKDK